MPDASLPDCRARSRPGIAMAAMMPMIATTINSSISVNPLLLFITVLPLVEEIDRLLVTASAAVSRAIPAP
jgi:hypothetical protein